MIVACWRTSIARLGVDRLRLSYYFGCFVDMDFGVCWLCGKRR